MTTMRGADEAPLGADDHSYTAITIQVINIQAMIAYAGTILAITMWTMIVEAITTCQIRQTVDEELGAD